MLALLGGVRAWHADARLLITRAPLRTVRAEQDLGNLHGDRRQSVVAHRVLMRHREPSDLLDRIRGAVVAARPYLDVE